MPDEPILPDTTTEPAEVTQPPAPVEAAPVIPDEAARAAAMESLPTLLRTTFEAETDDENLADVAQGITEEGLRALPKDVQVILRATIRAQIAAEAKATAAHEARETEWKRKDAAQAAKDKSIRQREQAMLALAAEGAKDPGAPPDVDPLTPEGAAKQAEYHARKALAEQNAPLLARKADLDRKARWESITEKYPDLADTEGPVYAEYLKGLREINAGIDVTKGEKPRIDAALYAEMFTNKRALAELTAQQTKAKTDQASDRRVAARSIGRVTTSGTASPTAAYHALIKKDDWEGAAALLESNPAMKAAVSRENGIGT